MAQYISEPRGLSDKTLSALDARYPTFPALEARAAEVAADTFAMPTTPLTDCNNAPDGFSIAQSDATNRPAGTGTASVILTTLHYSGFAAPYIFQTATREDNGQVYSRFKYGDNWNPWLSPGDPHFDANGYLNMGNKGISWVFDPINPQDAATKHYVDSRTVALTQAEYDALATKDPNILYLVTD